MDISFHYSLTLRVIWILLYPKFFGRGEGVCTLQFYSWHKTETYTTDTPWQKTSIVDVITLVTRPKGTLQIKNPCCRRQQKLKTNVNEFLSSRGLIGEIFKFIPPLNLEILRGLYFSIKPEPVNFLCPGKWIIYVCS